MLNCGDYLLKVKWHLLKVVRLLRKAINKSLKIIIFEAADKMLAGIWSEPLIVIYPVLAAYTGPQEREDDEVITHTPEE